MLALKRITFVTVFFFAVCVVGQFPHNVTQMQSSAWIITKENVLVQSPAHIQPTMGYWKLSGTNLVQNISNIPGWDHLWEVNVLGYLVQKVGD